VNREDFEPEGRARCADCGGFTEPDLSDMGHDADFDRCDCTSQALTVVPPADTVQEVAYRYEVQLGAGWHVPCATFRRALEVSHGQPWCRIVRWNYVPVDEDDDGLDENEQLAIACGEGLLRDALVAVIDGFRGAGVELGKAVPKPLLSEEA